MKEKDDDITSFSKEDNLIEKKIAASRQNCELRDTDYHGDCDAAAIIMVGEWQFSTSLAD
jgi:hypothetical protein